MGMTTLRIGLVLLLFCAAALPCAAQPVRDRVLGEVEIQELPESVAIRVGFNFPVRYLGHFPDRQGRELRVRLAPIAVAAVDRDALYLRETSAPERPNLPGLTEIVYEGDTQAGQFLSLRFQGIAYWQVSQGADYRSLLIRVSPPYPSLPVEKKSE